MAREAVGYEPRREGPLGAATQGLANVVPKPAAGDRPPCVGVLFVHGAGEHTVGTTLTEFGEPLIRWLDGWLSHGGQDSDAYASAGAAQLLMREGDEPAPAHVMVELAAPASTIRHQWVLAESRWDGAFAPPTPRSVLMWALSIVPWTVLTQFLYPVIDSYTKTEARALAIFRQVWDIASSVMISLTIAVVVQALAIGLLVLSIAPIPALRDFIGNVQRWAALSIGDLYLVLTSEVQRGALSGAVQRDVRWLRTQGCTRIAVVAHSQGGYVAYRALTDPWRSPVEKFLTLGSGLIRLKEADRALHSRRSIAMLVGIASVGAMVVGGLGYVGALVQGSIPADLSVDAFLVGALGTGVLVGVLLDDVRNPIRIDPLPDPTPWTDYLASADPVVNGDPARRMGTAATLIPVFNQASVVADHTTYWSNADQFVALVSQQIGAIDPDLSLISAITELEPFDRSVRERRHRVDVLERWRLLMIGAATLLLFAARAHLAEMGRAAADAAKTVLAAAPAGWVDAAGISGLMRSSAALVGAAEVVAGSLLWYRLGVAIWNRWNASALSVQWRRAETPRIAAAGVAFRLWILGFVALAGVIGAALGPPAVARPLLQLWDRRDAVVATATVVAQGSFVGALVLFLMGAGFGRARDVLAPAIAGVGVGMTVGLAAGIGGLDTSFVATWLGGLAVVTVAIWHFGPGRRLTKAVIGRLPRWVPRGRGVAAGTPRASSHDRYAVLSGLAGALAALEGFAFRGVADIPALVLAAVAVGWGLDALAQAQSRALKLLGAGGAALSVIVFWHLAST